MKSKTVFVSLLFIFISIKSASANFFKNITDLIENNYESLRYGISVADVDNDGVLNPVDNCIDTYNPSQDDLDMDSIGDACDPCNNLVYIAGNINGDINITDGTPLVDIFDILTLSDHIQTGDFSDCQMSVVNINNDSHINILDVITLVQLILNS